MDHLGWAGMDEVMLRASSISDFVVSFSVDMVDLRALYMWLLLFWALVRMARVSRTEH